jgi:sugar (pentulose or hexulose) kinase
MRTNTKKMLAIDMGATSIRGVLAWKEEGHLITEEVLRFSHKPVRTDDGLCWDFSGILQRIADTIQEYGAQLAASA